MTDGTALPERIGFDAEPLVAYFCDEPGSDTVETYVDADYGAVTDVSITRFRTESA